MEPGERGFGRELRGMSQMNAHAAIGLQALHGDAKAIEPQPVRP